MVSRALSYIRRISPAPHIYTVALARLRLPPFFIAALHISASLIVPALIISYVLLSGKILDGLYNADMLLPADHLWSVWHHEGGWSSFQLPRIPSYLPDLAVYDSLTALFGNWRAAGLIYALLSVSALILLGAGLIRRLFGTTYVAAVTVIAPAVTVALLVEALNLQIDKATGREYAAILMPVIHSGSLLLTLGGACLMPLPNATAPAWRTWAVWALAFFGVQSDLLFLFSFVLPWCLMQLAHSRDWRSWRRAGFTVLAALAGHFSLIHVFMQKTPGLSSKRLAEGMLSLGYDLTHLSLNTLTLGLGMAASVVLLRRTTTNRLLSLFVLTSLWLPFLAFLTVYRDAGSYRYLQTLMWIPLFILTAPLATGRFLTATRTVAAIVSLSGIVWALQTQKAPQALSWRTPLQTCLSQLAGQNLIHAGLSDYWLARTTTVSSDFTLQIEPVKGDGSFYIWGNDPYWFTHAFSGTGAPVFDFVLIKDLDKDAIRNRFGRPDRIYTCPGRAKAPGSEVWAYDRPGGL